MARVHLPDCGAVAVMLVAGVAAVVLMAITLPAHAVDAPLSLAEALRLATAESPELAAQRALAEGASISIGPAGALPDPTVRIAQENWPTTTSFRWTRYDVMAVQRLTLSQEFPGGRKLSMRTQRASADARRQLTMIDVQKALIQREAAIAWMTRYFADQAEARVVDQIKEAELAVETGSAQYRSGRASQAELVALQSAVVELKNRRSAAALQAKRARIALARFIGPEANRPLGDTPDISRLPDVAAGAVEVDELPEVRAALSREAVAAADADLAREDYRPDWKVELSYGWRGNSPLVQVPFSTPLGGKRYSELVSLEFSIALPTSTRTRQGPRLEAKLREFDAAGAAREDVKRQQLAEVQGMISDWESAQRQVMRIKDDLIPLVVRKREAAVAAYRGGTGRLADVLEARRDDLDVRLALVQQELAAAKAWAWLALIYSVTE